MHRQRVASLEEKIGYTFNCKDVAAEALTHRSYYHYLRKGDGASVVVSSNERLEFLGDAVLELAISTRLWHLKRKMDEGALTRSRSNLVNESTLAEIGRQFDFPSLVLVGPVEAAHGAVNRDPLLADVVEAVIGAVYLDGGFDSASKLIYRLFMPMFEQRLEQGVDFKTRLQEYWQKKKGSTPRYQTIQEHGPSHQKVFEVAVFVGQEKIGQGVGNSKKQAAQQAAVEAWEKIEGVEK